MTRDRAKELLPVIQAYAEGKTVQVKGSHPSSEWLDHSDQPYFEDMGVAFRIKPEPRVWWVADCGFGVTAFTTEDAAKRHSHGRWEIIKVQEVL